MIGSSPPFAPVNEQDSGDVVEVLVRTLSRRDRVSPEEHAALAAALGQVRVHPAGDVLVRAGAPVGNSTLLLDGLISREFQLPDGKRQIVALHVPGDFVDLHSLLLKKLDHDVVALSDVRVALFPHEGLRHITETRPHLTRMLWLLTTIDAAVHREWTARLGHPALIRVAQLLCELYERLTIVGGASEQGFPLQLTQADIADMTGLTAVHVNRTLRRLREAGLAIVRSGYASIPAADRLAAFCGFDPTYLYMHHQPR